MSALSDPAGRLRTSGSLTPRPLAPALARYIEQVADELTYIEQFSDALKRAPDRPFGSRTGSPPTAAAVEPRALTPRRPVVTVNSTGRWETKKEWRRHRGHGTGTKTHQGRGNPNG